MGNKMERRIGLKMQTVGATKKVYESRDITGKQKQQCLKQSGLQH